MGILCYFRILPLKIHLLDPGPYTLEITHDDDRQINFYQIKYNILMLRYTGHALLLVLGAIFVFHSPFTQWWAGLNLPWYSVFILWLLLIVLVALDNFTSAADSSDDDDNRGN